MKMQSEKFQLFKHSPQVTPRIEKLTNFCLKNKRVINQLIKKQNQAFLGEVEVFIQHMPNLLDFENKRVFFKKEIKKMRG